ncbi:MAG: Rne/Rng family ribonuclease [Prevotellaceae bacterium]|nr:Rne/Rng family ribonuclease [Prevotellaceae bacterium]
MSENAMVNNELVIDVASSEISIALLEDKRLVEFSKEVSNSRFLVGDIYFGRVKKLLPALNAAFIDVGHDKDAFIHYLDLGANFNTLTNFVKDTTGAKQKAAGFKKVRRASILDKEGKIQDVLVQGQNIVVQIVKEPISTKGPRLTSEISLAGRNMVLIPFTNKISISQKISEQEEKKRLRNLIESIIPPNYGVIVRTAAEGKRAAVLDGELKMLIQRWESCCEKLASGISPPQLLVNEVNRTTAILRDISNVSFNNIYANDLGVVNEIREFISTILPGKERIVKYYEGNVPILDQFGISKQIKGTFGRVVPLKKGIYLVVERTEALHVIDVNSGARHKTENDQETSALEVNLTAAEEIVHQIRLRDLGGIIIIDFIDMYNQENRQLLYEKMCALLENDRAKHSVLPLTKFGLMQITRQRTRPEMRIKTDEICPACLGSGHVAPSILLDDQIENQLAYYKNETGMKSVTLKTHPYIAAYLRKGFPSLLTKWKIRYKCLIKLEAVNSFSFLEYQFFNKKGERIDH